MFLLQRYPYPWITGHDTRLGLVMFTSLQNGHFGLERFTMVSLFLFGLDIVI